MEVNENKVALVSEANTGVGYQVAKALADNGYKFTLFAVYTLAAAQ